MAIRYAKSKTIKRSSKPEAAKPAGPKAPKPAARKPGRPLASEAHLTAEATKPWDAAGMSRRTWYRRQREVRDGVPAKAAVSAKKH